MIVVRSDALGGMAPAALRPLFGLTDDELIVVIRIEDGPPVPQRGPVDPDIPPPPEAVSLRVEAAPVAPALLQSVAPAYPAAEDRMHSLNELQQRAADQRLHLEATGGVYTLHGALGQQSYLSLAQVHNALRFRRFS